MTINKKKIHQFYDPLYGHIELTPVEYKIIDHPIYQRLRWIKQLGFTFYVFPGAEHTRFLHSIGVMHTASKIMQNIGMISSIEDILEMKKPHARLAQHIRLAALLHDIGQFPFSHTVEQGYIRSSAHKIRNDNHEHLGSFIIRRSYIAKILEQYDCDPILISKIIKGTCSERIANQILHSDVDADRLDYLYRDSLYTGVKYGNFDRDYIISNAQIAENTSGVQELVFHENAQQAIEGMLHSRFSWYSQVLKSNQGVKFDLMAGILAEYFIDQKIMPSFKELMDWAANDHLKFFQFNDQYFLTKLMKEFSKKHPVIFKDLMEIIIYRKSPKTIRTDDLVPQICKNKMDMEAKSKRVMTIVKEWERKVKKDDEAWMIYDIDASVRFCSQDDSQKVRLVTSTGRIIKLVNHPASTIGPQENLVKLIPNIFCNSKAYSIINS